MIVAVTGHRPERLKGQEEMIKKWAKDQLIALQPESVYIGMARGTDQLIGGVAKNLGIPLICCYPFPRESYSPTEQWLMDGEEVLYLTPSYSKKAYLVRDEYMVDCADALLCVWDGIPQGGAYYTRRYAAAQHKEIVDYGGLRK